MALWAALSVGVLSGCGDALAQEDRHYAHPEAPGAASGRGDFPFPPPELVAPEPGTGADDERTPSAPLYRVQCRVRYGSAWVRLHTAPQSEDLARTVMGALRRDLAHREHELTLLRIQSVETVSSDGSYDLAHFLRDALRHVRERKRQDKERGRPQEPQAHAPPSAALCRQALCPVSLWPV